MKISSSTPVVTPAQARPAPVATPPKQPPVSDSTRPVAQPPKPPENNRPVDNPLKVERTTATAAETVRRQHIQPTPDVPPAPVSRHADNNFGSHPDNNATPGTRAYATMEATAKVTGKGNRVNTSA